MFPEDQHAFLDFVQRRDPVVVTDRSGCSAGILPVKHFDDNRIQILCLWHRGILPELSREFIPESDQGPYYTVDDFKLPVLEFVSSFQATWEGKPALGQGRLFGNFEPYLGKPPEFEKWYLMLARWIRQNYRRNPTGLGGYVGPAAYEFYEKGGYLLPNFLPPRTKEWLAEIGKQHSKSRATLRVRSH
jgi:hypothetical protein